MKSKRQEERVAAYSKIAEEYNKQFTNELQKKPLDRKFYDLFYDKVINTGKVLEIGCGPGQISNYLWMRGLDITGIDVSPEMIEVATKYNSNIEFVTGNVFELKYDDESIHGVVAPFLIVNFDLEEVAEAFKEIHRILVQEGVFLVTFHVGNDEKVVINDYLEAGNKLTFTHFRVKTIKDLLAKTGFTVTETIVKEPYEGEKTIRAFIFAKK